MRIFIPSTLNCAGPVTHSWLEDFFHSTQKLVLNSSGARLRESPSGRYLLLLPSEVFLMVMRRASRLVWIMDIVVGENGVYLLLE